MALISCTECQKEVSDKASTCPHCGILINSNEQKSETELTSQTLYHVEIAGIKKPRISKKIRATAASLISLIIVVMLFSVIWNNIVQQRIRTEYIQNLNDFKELALEGAGTAEIICDLTRSVWNNTIFKVDDSITDIFTKTRGTFNDDFNISLRALYEFSLIIEWVEKIEENQSSVAELYIALQNPPEEFIRIYEVVESMYGYYTSITNLAISPEGSLQSYTERFRNLRTGFSEDYGRLGLLIPE